MPDDRFPYSPDPDRWSPAPKGAVTFGIVFCAVVCLLLCAPVLIRAGYRAWVGG